MSDQRPRCKVLQFPQKKEPTTDDGTMEMFGLGVEDTIEWLLHEGVIPADAQNIVVTVEHVPVDEL